MNVLTATAAAVAQRSQGKDEEAAASELTAGRARTLVRALLPRMSAVALAADALSLALAAARGVYSRDVEDTTDESSEAIHSWRSILELYAYSEAQLEAVALALESDVAGAAAD